LTCIVACAYIYVHFAATHIFRCICNIERVALLRFIHIFSECVLENGFLLIFKKRHYFLLLYLFCLSSPCYFTFTYKLFCNNISPCKSVSQSAIK